MTSVYVGMSMDMLHHGHISIIEQARKYGEVTVGLLSDTAVAERDRLPYLSFEQRKRIVENIRGVSSVVPQDEWDFVPNLLKYKPDIMLHGDDWLEGSLSTYRERAREVLSEYGGHLIEVPHTSNHTTNEVIGRQQVLTVTPDTRRRALKRILAAKPISRFIEAHNPISALIAEHITAERNGKTCQFDGFWSSSLTDTTARGKVGIDEVEINHRLANISDMFDVTTKPLIMDMGTGGKLEHFELNVRSIERLGISATIIADRVTKKRNASHIAKEEQEDIDSFCDKIIAGRAARTSSDFMIIARIESLVLAKGMKDAVTRAQAYVGAGVDGIMIHSQQSAPVEVYEFATQFKDEFPEIPLACIPSSFCQVSEEQLAEQGFNIVVYPNHLLRAAYPAMQKVAQEILRHGRSAEVENNLMPIQDVLAMLPNMKASPQC